MALSAQQGLPASNHIKKGVLLLSFILWQMISLTSWNEHYAGPLNFVLFVLSAAIKSTAPSKIPLAKFLKNIAHEKELARCQ